MLEGLKEFLERGIKNMGDVEQMIQQLITSTKLTTGIKKPGTGAAAGVTQTPPPPSGVGATTGFDAEYYLGTSPSVAEALAQVDSKKAEADMAEKQANAQLEQGTKDMALQNLNAIKTMVEALINAFKEIRDTQDQVKANIARNA